MKLTKTNILKVLKKLGYRTETIRRSLIKLKIKGPYFNSTSCPIARFLYTFYSNATISVTNSYINIDYIKINCNKALRNFIDNFDDKMYPELIEN